MSICKRSILLAIVATIFLATQSASAVITYEISVASYINNSVLRYNSATSTVSTYSNGAGGLTHPEGVGYGPDGLVYVTSADQNKVLRYDPATGAYANTFATTNMNLPVAVDFANNKVYIVNNANSNSNRFSSAGTFEANFATPASDPSGFYRATFAPDGSYFMTGYATGLHKFNSSGTEIFSSGSNPFVTVTALGGSSTLVDAAIGPDGNLYVAKYVAGTILRINPSTGAVLDTVLSGLNTPYGIVFTPDNKLYIASYLGSNVTSYDFNATISVPWTGATTVITSANGLDHGAGIDFTYLPEPASLGLLVIVVPMMARRRAHAI